MRFVSSDGNPETNSRYYEESDGARARVNTDGNPVWVRFSAGTCCTLAARYAANGIYRTEVSDIRVEGA